MPSAEVAAMFATFARVIDAELAAGTPAKAVAQAAADVAREYDHEIRNGEMPAA